MLISLLMSYQRDTGRNANAEKRGFAEIRFIVDIDTGYFT
jgi:hypothetical protein